MISQKIWRKSPVGAIVSGVLQVCSRGALDWGGGGNRTSVNHIVARSFEFGRADSTYLGADLYPFASLAWTQGNDNWMADLTGDIRMGANDSGRLANLGFGHAAINAGGRTK